MQDNPVDQLIEDFVGKNVLIFGLGLLGRGIGDTKFFASIGANVRVTDKKTSGQLSPALKQFENLPISYTFGQHLKKDIDWADAIIRNASVPWHHPLLDYARSLQKPIYMDTQLFIQYAGINVVGITGTRGKTTTTRLIYHILTQLSGYQVLLGGNIQNIATLPLLKDIKEPNQTIAILELSSWQLQAFNEYKISPNIAVVTNIYPDHLNRYDSMEDYIQDKKAIICHQKSSDTAILNRQQYHELKNWQTDTQAEIKWFDAEKLPENIITSLKGKHNLENIAAAWEVVKQLIPNTDEIRKAVNSFSGVPYRLEFVKEINGIKIINDTTSTTPTSTIKAIESFSEPVTLICGGTDKKLPINDLVKVINHHVNHIVLISGNGTDRIKNLIDTNKIVTTTVSLQTAITSALSVTKPGEVILFSPGFASFGLFINEFDRGERFNKIIARMT